MELVKRTPLYLQVKRELQRRIVDKEWLPASMIPNETVLAKELNVSQGTIRRALDEMSEEKVIYRKQGIGSFVRDETNISALKSFFKIYSNDNKLVKPSSKILSSEIRVTNSQEAKIFKIGKKNKVVNLKRVCSVKNDKIIYDDIVIKDSDFPNIIKRKDLPHALYSLYNKEYGIVIAKVDDKISAVILEKWLKDIFGIKVKEDIPALKNSRIVYNILGNVIEIRNSYILTQNHHYQVNLI